MSPSRASSSLASFFSSSVGRLTIIRYSTSFCNFFLTNCLPVPETSRPSREESSGRLRRRLMPNASFLFPCNLFNPGTGTWPPVTKEIIDPLFAGWLGSLNRDFIGLRCSAGRTKGVPGCFASLVFVSKQCHDGGYEFDTHRKPLLFYPYSH